MLEGGGASDKEEHKHCIWKAGRRILTQLKLQLKKLNVRSSEILILVEDSLPPREQPPGTATMGNPPPAYCSDVFSLG